MVAGNTVSFLASVSTRAAAAGGAIRTNRATTKAIHASGWGGPSLHSPRRGRTYRRGPGPRLASRGAPRSGTPRLKGMDSVRAASARAPGLTRFPLPFPPQCELLAVLAIPPRTTPIGYREYKTNGPARQNQLQSKPQENVSGVGRPTERGTAPAQQRARTSTSCPCAVARAQLGFTAEMEGTPAPSFRFGRNLRKIPPFSLPSYHASSADTDTPS